MIKLVNVKMHTPKKTATIRQLSPAAPIAELGEPNGGQAADLSPQADNGSTDAPTDAPTDPQTDAPTPKSPEMITTADTVLHDVMVDKAWHNCEQPSELFGQSVAVTFGMTD